MNAILDSLRGQLVVSCQAYPGEPMLDPRTMSQVAQAAVTGGAAAIRAKGLDDLRAIRAAVDVPIIGLVKEGATGVYITPTLESCIAVAETGCEIVALDGTRRDRPDGLTLAETVACLKERFPEVLVMADCGSAGDAAAAQEAGADIIGTTLVGYSGERPKTDGPDWEAIDEIIALADRPVLVEGRVHSPADAAESIRRGAWGVVVGTAITHPATITSWFAKAVAEA
ncbi:N-acetylmannosamine-6-phosphate 2-epimerase [Tessaracoccus flavus]|uniref:Putative N-acetylmannosamine-6-phosphate 2-epimerase n=1 Tax=Tessaracoccus flavus TaxID=1610493 RepID=A0A1Q2CHB2_9ACTN|nr:N-acetylmannosamine-6-phosphate 2-epimerase [Tessaracoccus flavus]AQP45502.1 N-acetylmannosamine-6-phosphate 2-epimerase [Tessaracoccus flavus]SDY80748.1 N-acylglucosamine-6-phosphate 2-epimerase [Tessaracoccus flavus]